MSNAAGLPEVRARAAVDAGYRRRLLESPHEAIEEVLGPLPAGGVRIGFVEKPADVNVLVVLPDAAPEPEPLTPEELEAVAGGADDECWWTCFCTGLCTGSTHRDC
jgi:hypothetical protein